MGPEDAIHRFNDYLVKLTLHKDKEVLKHAEKNEEKLRTQMIENYNLFVSRIRSDYGEVKVELNNFFSTIENLKSYPQIVELIVEISKVREQIGKKRLDERQYVMHFDYFLTYHSMARRNKKLEMIYGYIVTLKKDIKKINDIMKNHKNRETLLNLVSNLVLCDNRKNLSETIAKMFITVCVNGRIDRNRLLSTTSEDKDKEFIKRVFNSLTKRKLLHSDKEKHLKLNKQYVYPRLFGFSQLIALGEYINNSYPDDHERNNPIVCTIIKKENGILLAFSNEIHKYVIFGVQYPHDTYELEYVESVLRAIKINYEGHEIHPFKGVKLKKYCILREIGYYNKQIHYCTIDSEEINKEINQILVNNSLAPELIKVLQEKSPISDSFDNNTEKIYLTPYEILTNSKYEINEKVILYALYDEIVGEYGVKFSEQKLLEILENSRGYQIFALLDDFVNILKDNGKDVDIITRVTTVNNELKPWHEAIDYNQQEEPEDMTTAVSKINLQDRYLCCYKNMVSQILEKFLAEIRLKKQEAYNRNESSEELEIKERAYKEKYEEIIHTINTRLNQLGQSCC